MNWQWLLWMLFPLAGMWLFCVAYVREQGAFARNANAFGIAVSACVFAFCIGSFLGYWSVL